MSKEQFSISPWGESFPFPSAEERRAELSALEKLAKSQKELGRETVVVIGLGFVGTVMAAVIADAVDDRGKPTKFVIGYQRPSQRSYWKIPLLNRGDCPVTSEDPEVPELIKRCVTQKKTLVATSVEEVLGLADVVVVDVQCDYAKASLGDVKTGTVDMVALEETFARIGEKIPPHALVLIETTVAPGTTEQIAFPIIKRKFETRGIDAPPLLAHSYERVMPGRNYVASVRDFWRVCSGTCREARDRVVAFLECGPQYQEVSADGPRQADRIGNRKNHREQLSCDHPCLHGRMVAVCGKKRCGSQEGH